MLSPVSGVFELRISRVPFRFLRADRLRLGLSPVLLPGSVRSGDSQLPTDGFLRGTYPGAGCQAPWSAAAEYRRQCFALGLHPGAGSAAAGNALGQRAAAANSA